MRPRCKVCFYEKDGKCKKKDIKVRINKPRTCEKFDLNPEKVEVKEELPITAVYYRDVMEAKIAKKNLKKMNLEQEVLNEKFAYTRMEGMQKPDCLANFRDEPNV